MAKVSIASLKRRINKQLGYTAIATASEVPFNHRLEGPLGLCS